MRHFAARPAAMLASILLLQACTAQPTAAPGGSPLGARPSDGGNAIAPSTFEIGPSVEPLLASDTGTRATVSATKGGTLTATGPDGTSYTLTLPAGAVDVDTVITMIPIDELGGEEVAFDGLVGGVELKPDGLVLREPGLLEILPATEVPLEEQVPFAYQENGLNLHLGPILPDPDRIALAISHFSGFGVAIARTLDGRASAARIGRVTPASVTAETSVALHRLNNQYWDAARRGEITREEALTRTLYLANLHFEQVIEPLISRAEQLAPQGRPEDIFVMSEAIALFLSWERQMQLVGSETITDSTRAEWATGLQALREGMLARLTGIMETFYAAVKDRCLSQHDFRVVTVPSASPGRCSSSEWQTRKMPPWMGSPNACSSRSASGRAFVWWKKMKKMASPRGAAMPMSPAGSPRPVSPPHRCRLKA